MTDEELAAIRERVDKASPGPSWNADFTDDDFNVRPDNACSMHDGRGWGMVRVESAENKDDILFMMYAREDIPALLAEVERLRAREAALRETLEEAYEQWRFGAEAEDQVWRAKARALLASEG